MSRASIIKPTKSLGASFAQFLGKLSKDGPSPPGGSGGGGGGAGGGGGGTGPAGGHFRTLAHGLKSSKTLTILHAHEDGAVVRRVFWHAAPIACILIGQGGGERTTTESRAEQRGAR